MKENENQVEMDSISYQKLIDEIEELSIANEELTKQYYEEKAQKDIAVHNYNLIAGSFWWKITKPGRVFTRFMKRFINSNPVTYVPITMLLSFRRNGFKRTFKEKTYVFKKYEKDEIIHQELVDMRFIEPLSTAERIKQRNTDFKRPVKISIIVPLYNTAEIFLREMIESVTNQTYTNWELCLADGSDKDNVLVTKICKEYCKKHKNILYKRLEKNMGISGNTNAALEMATGNFISLFDHDDLLKEDVLFEVVKAINEQDADFVYTDELTFEGNIENVRVVHLKSDYAIDTLRANNYICHFTTFSKELYDKVGGFREKCDGSQDFDMVLRLTEQAKKICHIPKVLYYWRSHPLSVASDIGAKPYVVDAAKRAISDHLKRCDIEGEVVDSNALGVYRVKYKLKETPLVSILIPNKDDYNDLHRCIESVVNNSTYSNYEIVIIENNSKTKEIFDYYKELKKNSKIKIVTWDKEFNYSAINNFGMKHISGKYVVLLNNDIEIITPEWIEEMLMYAQRDDVGAVGGMLYYPDDTIQHAGVAIGLMGVAAHLNRHVERGQIGYMGKLSYSQNLTAVTAACLMVSARKYCEIGGFEEELKFAFNDIDFCLKLRSKGYLNVFTPFVEAYHHKSVIRWVDDANGENLEFNREIGFFKERWGKELEAGDPYHNPNFSKDFEYYRM